MSTIIAATDADTLKNAAMGLSAASLLVAVVLLKVISGIVGRIVSTVILVAIALVGYSQRTNITSCVDKLKATNAEALVIPPRCEFFGNEIEIKVPQLTK